MKIILVRHGDAVGADIAGQDWDRWLSARGRHDVAQTATKLMQLGLGTGVILSSPLVRALQTAELLAAVREESDREVMACRALASEEASLAEVRSIVNDVKDIAVLSLVGHMPFLQELGSDLCDDRDFPPLRTATACVLERLTTRWNLAQTVGA